MECSLLSMVIDMVDQTMLKTRVFYAWFPLFLYFSINMFILMLPLAQQVVLELLHIQQLYHNFG